MFQQLLDTEHKRKSAVITAVIAIILLLLLFLFGLKYLDPPLERGVAINFGTTDVGSGDLQPQEPVRSQPEITPTNPETTPQEEVLEEVITQDQVEAPQITDKQEEIKKPVENQKPKEETKPQEKPEPQPDKSTTETLDSFIKGPAKDGENTQGEGNDQEGGDKGSPDGDPNSSSYYGQGVGLDGDGNYLLGGRRALSKEKYLQDCNEEGVVVVRIEVDRNGKVVSASPGVKGTTNSHPCLTEPAKRAALATKFNSDSKAPAVQIGFIKYRFKLGE